MIEQCIFHSPETGRFIFAEVHSGVLHLLEINIPLIDAMLCSVPIYTDPDDVPLIFHTGG